MMETLNTQNCYFLSNKLYSVKQTIAVDIYYKYYSINQSVVKLNFWDFSGAREYAAIRSEFYRESHGVVFVFDLTNPVSFDNLENWMKECKKFGGEKLFPILIGTKCDLGVIVQTSDIEKWCNRYKIGYFEVNGLNYDKVCDCFKEYSKLLIKK